MDIKDAEKRIKKIKPEYFKKLNLKLVKSEYKSPIHGKITKPEQLYKIFKSIKDKAQETLLSVYLDNDLRCRVYDVLSVGGQDQTAVLIHEVYRHAILVGAEYFILIHNHPKGNPSPSKDDKLVIEELQTGSKQVKLKFLDFLIIGDLNSKKKKNYWSMYEEEGGGEYALGSVK